MKKTLLALIFCFLTVTTATAKQEVVVYCDDGYPPYAYEENGMAKGIYVKILETAFRRMEDYTVKIEPVPWKRGLNLMETGKGFALFPPYYRPDERPYLDHAVSLMFEEIAIIAREGVNITSLSKWPEDFEGLTMGLNEGFAVINVKEIPDSIVIDYSPNNRTAMMKLAFSRIDFYVNDKMAILDSKAKIEAEERKLPGFRWGPVLQKEEAFVVFSNTNDEAYPYKQDFIDKLNLILEGMKQNGEFFMLIEESL